MRLVVRDNLLCVALLVAIFATGVVQLTPAHGGEPGALQPLKVKGGWLEDPAGNKVVLKGCNLGNWLLLEPWMLGIAGDFRDQHEIVTTLERRFGCDRAEQLMDLYRRNWITGREFEYVKSFGFNVVRVPIHHHLLATEAAPLALRDDAFEWLDRAVELAEDAGVYVILDLHGTPGGQSGDMTTGRVGQNKLWTDAASQERTVFLWREIAKRYRSRASVVAYDLINEPWGTPADDIRSELVSMVDRLCAAIREVDRDTLIFAPGSTRGIACYGDPLKRGWINVGFTDHFYPGIFDNGQPTLSTHFDFLNSIVPAQRDRLSGYAVPYLIGEFNVVFDFAAQPEMMRLYYDTFAEHGWLATMWSLRLLNPRGGVHRDNWYLLTNAEPLAMPDLRTATFAEIETTFKRLGTVPLAADEELRQALTAPRPPNFVTPSGVVRQPADVGDANLPGWRSVAIGGAQAGRAFRRSDGAIVVSGSGLDVWANHDEFQYVCREADEAFAVEAWLTSFDAPHRHAKAGWMLRAGSSAGDAMAFVHVFEDGRVMLASRDDSGGAITERCLSISGFPVGIGLARDTSGLHVRYTDLDGQWRQQTVSLSPRLTSGGLIGMGVCAHEDDAFAQVTFQGVDGARGSTLGVSRGGANLLQNGSFESAQGGDSGSDRAAHWQRWGDWMNRETDWTPTRAGACLMGYHHWQVTSDGNSGLYQDVSGLTPGRTYTFSIDANRDVGDAASHGPASVEIRLESPSRNRQLRCAAHTYDATDIGSGAAWSRLSVTGVAVSDTLRVLVIVQPSDAAPRASALKFDRATLLETDSDSGS